jgi:hypothetical protein
MPTVVAGVRRKNNLWIWLSAGLLILALIVTVFILRDQLSRLTATSTSVPSSLPSSIPPTAKIENTKETPIVIITADPCAGATDPGAREMFTLEQITPCLDTVPKVTAFMKNNTQRDDGVNDAACGNPCYSTAALVYEKGVDDLHGLVTLECYLLEMNGVDAYHLGLSIEQPVGSNFCSVNTAEGVLILDANAEMIGTFPSLAEVARFSIERNWMVNGGLMRTIRASQITQTTSMQTSPNLMELPWVFHSY